MAHQVFHHCVFGHVLHQVGLLWANGKEDITTEAAVPNVAIGGRPSWRCSHSAGAQLDLWDGL